MSSAMARESALRADAEVRASTAELQLASLQAQLANLRVEAAQAVETTQRAADVEKARLIREAAAVHSSELESMRSELAAANSRAERLQNALHALTG